MAWRGTMIERKRAVGEADDALEQLALGLVEDAGVGALGDHRLHLLLGHRARRLAAEARGGRAPPRSRRAGTRRSGVPMAASTVIGPETKAAMPSALRSARRFGTSSPMISET